MIFVTVGTHEQPFNRLVKYMDDLKKDGKIEEEVIIQVGFSTYKPEYCKWNKLFPYSHMMKNVERARIVITHGGPSSFIAPLQIGKIPIVVPRRKEFGEHVNNHQVEFCRKAEKKQGNIIVVDDISELEEIIKDYNKIVDKMPAKLNSNNQKFNYDFENLVNELMGKNS